MFTFTLCKWIILVKLFYFWCSYLCSIMIVLNRIKIVCIKSKKVFIVVFLIHSSQLTLIPISDTVARLDHILLRNQYLNLLGLILVQSGLGKISCLLELGWKQNWYCCFWQGVLIYLKFTYIFKKAYCPGLPFKGLVSKISPRNKHPELVLYGWKFWRTFV